MSTETDVAPRITHRVPGRVRLHSPAWRGADPRIIAGALRVPGVLDVRANPVTGSVVVYYNEACLAPGDLLRFAARAGKGPSDTPDRHVPNATHARDERHARAERPVQRIRVAVPGLEGDGRLAWRIVAELTARQYRVEASSLTGRVLIETTRESGSLEGALRALSALAPRPTLPTEDTIETTASDRGQALFCLAAAGAALTILAVRAATGSSGGATALKVAAGMALVQGVPAVNRSLEKKLGPRGSQLAFALPRTAALAFAGSPLGLVVIAAEALLELSVLSASPPDEPAASVPNVSQVLERAAGQCVMTRAVVLAGRGTAVASDGLPTPVSPGSIVPAGARLYGGEFRLRPLPVQLPDQAPAKTADPEPASLPLGILLSAGFSLSVALVTRSLSRGIVAMLLTSPRANIAGGRAVRHLASASLRRAGIRLPAGPHRNPPRLPDAVVVAAARVLTDGCALVSAQPAGEQIEPNELIRRAGALATAADDPWGPIAGLISDLPAEDVRFDGEAARGRVGGVPYRLSAAAATTPDTAFLRLHHAGRLLLRLERENEGVCEGTLIVEPALSHAALDFAAHCRRAGIDVLLDETDNPAGAARIAAQLQIRVTSDARGDTWALRSAGRNVAVLADSVEATGATSAASLSLVIDSGEAVPGAQFIRLPELSAFSRMVDVVQRSDHAARDVTGLTTLGAVAGAGWSSFALVNLRRATLPSDLAALGGLTSAWLRFHDLATDRGRRRLSDPQPERWAELSTEELLSRFGTTAEGLSSAEAAARRRPVEHLPQRNELLAAVRESAISPLTAFVGGALGLTLLSGARADAAVMATTLILNIAVGAWQSYRVGNVQSELERLGRSSARVLRDGKPHTVSADEVVPGDVLVLGPGERIVADARVLEAAGFEVDESPLTGESLPVRKAPDAPEPGNRVVLEGTDVIVGSAKVLVVAVGSHTRLGVMARAVAESDGTGSALADRLAQLFRQVLPVTVLGGATVMASGVLRGRPALSQAIMGASIALAALPEALPILAGMGQAAAARRLRRRNVLVRRSAAIEALGRVDVACVDKTGTLTENRLQVRRIVTVDRDLDLEYERPGNGERAVLLSAALASPHPDAHDARSHSTDVAVLRAAVLADLNAQMRAERHRVARFDQTRPFHAAIAGGRLHVKGAPEALATRCTAARVAGLDLPLDERHRQDLLDRAEALACLGYRVLLVAEGEVDQSPEDPQGLVVVGLLGIHDPLRRTVPAAVARCHEAGIRVIMLTGDHPATARRVAMEAGLLDGGTVLTGPALANLPDSELDDALDEVTVIARATPLDKVRIIESLRRRGHTIAMTGDGINDAAALRLADVGVAMGKGGTEVARQAADVIVGDDDFSNLVEALVEGRSFWCNLRRSIGLLLGGNLGELAYMVAGSVFGMSGALTVRQVLATNLITDALPAFAVAVQEPEHRRLDRLQREGNASLGKPLQDEILRRTVATAVPALGAYLAAAAGAAPAHARSVGFATIVSSQLALTVQSGRAQGSLTRPVIAGVGISAAALVALLTAPPLRTLFELSTPTPFGWVIVGSATLAAVLLGQAPYGVPRLGDAGLRPRLAPALLPLA